MWALRGRRVWSSGIPPARVETTALEAAWALTIEHTKRYQENEMEKSIAKDGLTVAFLVAMLGLLCCVH